MKRNFKPVFVFVIERIGLLVEIIVFEREVEWVGHFQCKFQEERGSKSPT